MTPVYLQGLTLMFSLTKNFNKNQKCFFRSAFIHLLSGVKTIYFFTKNTAECNSRLRVDDTLTPASKVFLGSASVEVHELKLDEGYLVVPGRVKSIKDSM